ncbi:hypothetical protein C7M84_007575 [Penaeus vannamei]|uniref:Uncharacterized protein n=1 Tax=Penaeus vannamei TaxID=6689 RepID=A0A3R7N0F4_PENVA|nr:hypothetical protein C7M84_007575 [Penaeus vannamei]
MNAVSPVAFAHSPPHSLPMLNVCPAAFLLHPLSRRSAALLLSQASSFSRVGPHLVPPPLPAVKQAARLRTPMVALRLYSGSRLVQFSAYSLAPSHTSPNPLSPPHPPSPSPHSPFRTLPFPYLSPHPPLLPPLLPPTLWTSPPLLNPPSPTNNLYLPTTPFLSSTFPPSPSLLPLPSPPSYLFSYPPCPYTLFRLFPPRPHLPYSFPLHSYLFPHLSSSNTSTLTLLPHLLSYLTSYLSPIPLTSLPTPPSLPNPSLPPPLRPLTPTPIPLHPFSTPPPPPLPHTTSQPLPSPHISWPPTATNTRGKTYLEFPGVSLGTRRSVLHIFLCNIYVSRICISRDRLRIRFFVSRESAVLYQTYFRWKRENGEEGGRGERGGGEEIEGEGW